MMNREETIDTLNILVTINNDRIDGYELAARESEQKDLIDLFTHNAMTSKLCNIELTAELKQLRGEPSEGTKLTGKFFRVWMEMKTAFSDNDRKTILNSCVFGEEKLLETYDQVLDYAAELLSPRLRTVAVAQRSRLKEDYDIVKSMRDDII
jgi:uncharacterized protein (TIGR02284 family)